MTIIEKIERYSDVDFAVVLYTPCDMGAKYGDLQFHYRARQNVVFEHGYFVGKLGRDRLAPLKKRELDTPNDISGIVYIDFEGPQVWKTELTKELRAAGYSV